MNRQHVNHKKIPSIGPSITQKEIDLVTEAVTHGWYENMNKYIDLFVEEFADFVEMKYCLPTAHCTDAIHLALLGLNIGPGDEVIVPDITWVASAAPITYVGATPVFADMDEKSWCLCPKSFERSITRRTRAVIVVDLFGNMPEMDELREIAEKYNIVIIEDAAEGIGAEYKNRPAGTFGQISVFSFNATKLVMSGQGGLLATNNKEIYERYKLLSHHGINKKPGDRYYWSNEIGYNYNWTNIQAALALAQFRRIDELLEKKHQIFNWYYERLKDVEGVKLNSQPKHIKPTYWISVAIVDEKYGMDKEFLEREFEKYNIDMRPFFYPISSMPPYAKYCTGKEMNKVNPISYKISPYGLCLPSGNNLTEDDVEFVCHSFQKILREAEIRNR